jgi:hypothetical protein
MKSIGRVADGGSASSGPSSLPNNDAIGSVRTDRQAVNNQQKAGTCGSTRQCKAIPLGE